MTAETGSVEYFAGLLRTICGDGHEVYVSALAIVGALSAPSAGSDSELLARVHNVVAAAELVLAELPDGAR